MTTTTSDQSIFNHKDCIDARSTSKFVIWAAGRENVKTYEQL